jgi:hypothetical protein
MPITYYYDSKFKKPYPNFEKIQKRKVILSASNGADLTTSGLNYTLWHPSENWVVHEVLMHFGAATARSYSVNKVIGRGIITNLNDLLWIRCDGYTAQSIYLDQGFYTGTTLATQIKTKLDADANFIAAGVAPFTVSYSATTGKFTIVTTAGNIQFINTNIAVGVNRNSTAGAVVGFAADSSFATSITSDTAVLGLGDLIPIDAEATSTDINTIVNVDSLSPIFDVDGALNLTIGTVATTVDYKISYEEVF